MKYLSILFWLSCGQADHEKVYLHNPHKVKYENIDSVAARGFYIHSKEGKNLIDLTIFAEHSVYIDGDLLDSVSNYNTVVINGYEYERKPPVYEGITGTFRINNGVYFAPDSIIYMDKDSILRIKPINH